jgi:signal peptidase
VKFIKVGLLLVIPLLLLATFIVLATGATPYKVYVIHTGSMNPTIPSGSAVIVHEGHYRIGQVVTFREDGLTVTHRLLSINAQGLTTTKGDANASPDPWHVPKSQIVGGVVAAPRYVGYWITYFKSPLGLASLVLVIAVLWQLWAITDRSSVDVVSEESRSAREKSRPKRRQGAEVPSGLVTATATMSPEPWVMQASGHAEASITEIMNTEVIEEGATLGRDQTEGAPISTNDESTSGPMTEASDVLVITEATPHQLGDDHDQPETTVASEDDVALDVESRERFDTVADLDPLITTLGDDSSPENLVVFTKDESTSVPMIEASDFPILTEATPHQLGDDHDQSEPTVASEDDVALDLETRERFDPVADLDPLITTLGDDSSSEISGATSSDDKKIDATPMELEQLYPFEHEVASTNDESTSGPMTEASDVLVITEATPHQLGDDHDQPETTVASEDDVALDVETRERFDPVADLDTAITALGDDASSDISAMASTNEEEISAAPVDFSSDIVDAAATNDEGIDPTPTELSQPSPLEDEEMRRARMAKWFGVVRTGPDRGFSGSRSR